MIRLSVNVNKVATLRNSRGGRDAATCSTRSRSASPPARPASPCIRAPTAGTSRPTTCARLRARSSRRARRRIQHRRRSAARLIDARRRGAAGSVHARAGRARRSHEPGRLAARVRRRSGLPDVIARFKSRGVRVSLFVDPEPEPIEWAAVGRRRPRRALHRAVRPRVRARAPRPAQSSFESYAAAAGWRTSLGLGVNAGHDLDLDNLVLFRELAVSSTRCRSATPSSRARSSSASNRRARVPAMFCRPPDMIERLHA